MINTLILLVIIGFGFYKYVWPIVSIFVYGDVRLNNSSKLDEDEYKKLTLGAPYASQQSAYQNSLTLGLSGEKLLKIANEWWGINNKEEAHDTLSYLRDEGHRTNFPVVYKALMAKDSDKAEKIITDGIKDPENLDKAFSQLQNLKDCFDELKLYKMIETQEDIGKYGVTAWDTGRLVFLARVCSDLKYISEPEAWEYIESAYKIAKKEFKSWEEYGKSYVIGRAGWGGKDSNNAGIASIVDTLLTDEKSPWVQFKF